MWCCQSKYYRKQLNVAFGSLCMMLSSKSWSCPYFFLLLQLLFLPFLVPIKVISHILDFRLSLLMLK